MRRMPIAEHGNVLTAETMIQSAIPPDEQSQAKKRQRHFRKLPDLQNLRKSKEILKSIRVRTLKGKIATPNFRSAGTGKRSWDGVLLGMCFWGFGFIWDFLETWYILDVLTPS